MLHLCLVPGQPRPFYCLVSCPFLSTLVNLRSLLLPLIKFRPPEDVTVVHVCLHLEC